MCPIASAATLSSTEVTIQTQRQGTALAPCRWIRMFKMKELGLGYTDSPRAQMGLPSEEVTVSLFRSLIKPPDTTQTDD